MYKVSSYFQNLHFKDNLFSFEKFSYIKKLTLTSLLASVGIILKLIEIPTFSSFLKLDFALIPPLMLIFIGTYPYIITCTLMIDLISLRGSIFGWLASIFFSLSLINGVFLFYKLFSKKIDSKLLSYNLAFLCGITISTVFLYSTNTYFITPAFFGMTYEELSSDERWKSFSESFFSIPNYETAMFIFYSTFNFLLKGTTLFILSNLISIPLFFRKKVIIKEQHYN